MKEERGEERRNGLHPIDTNGQYFYAGRYEYAVQPTVHTMRHLWQKLIGEDIDHFLAYESAQ